MHFPILGVDPSFNRTGWAIIVEDTNGPRLSSFGVISPKGASRPDKLLSIERAFRSVLAQHPIASAALETPGNWRRRAGTWRGTIETMAMARAMMLVECARANLETAEVSWGVARGSLIGRQNATSTDVVAVLQSIGFDVPTRPRGGPDLDIANAMLIALYAARAPS